MTAFGKILAFLNLVFAIITGALIGMVYLTRTNWEQAYRQVQAKAVAADASYKQLLATEMGQVVAKDTLLQKAINDRDANAKTITQKEAEIDQVKKQLEATQHTVGDDAQTTKTLTAEIERRRREVLDLKSNEQKLELRIRDLEGQLTIVRNDAVQNKLKYDSLNEKQTLLLNESESLKREIAEYVQQGARKGSGNKLPPPDAIRGTVKEVSGNLATISIGSDAGVNKDNILYLYRLSPKEVYLGQLTILKVTPFEAVGRIEPAQRQTQVKPGDEVASQITTKK